MPSQSTATTQLNKVELKAYIHWCLWQPLYGPCVTLEHSLQPAGISCMLVFAEGGKPENPEKNRRSREENQHKLNPLKGFLKVMEVLPTTSTVSRHRIYFSLYVQLHHITNRSVAWDGT